MQPRHEKDFGSERLSNSSYGRIVTEFEERLARPLILILLRCYPFQSCRIFPSMYLLCIFCFSFMLYCFKRLLESNLVIQGSRGDFN